MSGKRNTDPIGISVVVLTYNEERNLELCLRSLVGWTTDIHIVDSGSTDATISIAENYGAKVLHHPFETHARQWAWTLENVPCSHEWILGLDADQRVTSELRAELTELFTTRRDSLRSLSGLYIKRRQVFRGQWIKHGGYYPKYLLKLFRRDKVHLDDRDWDHHFYVDGKVAKLANDLVEDNQKERDIAFWIDKHNRYATLHAKEELERRLRKDGWSVQPAFFGSPDQRVVWLKQRWYLLPLYIRPILYFSYRFVLRAGFLDGKQGFIFHFLQAFWYRLLVDIHIEDLLNNSVNRSKGVS